MPPLAGAITIVTGGSRGIGKGIALALGQAGATVYVTGRSRPGGDTADLTVEATVEAINRSGGTGIVAHCDHRQDPEVRAVFARIADEQGRLDLLVNNATALPRRADLPPGMVNLFDLHPFWEVPLRFWDEIHAVGLRSHYVASAFAAPLLIATGHGLIVNVSSAFAVRPDAGNVAYGVGKAGVDKLAQDMAFELRPYGVASVSIWPPLTTTEDFLAEPGVEQYLSSAYSPLFTGHAVAALAADPAIMERTGSVLKVLDLAREYGLTDRP